MFNLRRLNLPMVGILALAVWGCDRGTVAPSPAATAPELRRTEAVLLIARLYAQEDEAVSAAIREIAATGIGERWPRLAVRPCPQAGGSAAPDFLCMEVDGVPMRFNRAVGERWQRVFDEIRKENGEAALLETARALDRVLESLYADFARSSSVGDAQGPDCAIALAGVSVSVSMQRFAPGVQAEELRAREQQWRARARGAGDRR